MAIGWIEFWWGYTMAIGVDRILMGIHYGYRGGQFCWGYTMAVGEDRIQLMMSCWYLYHMLCLVSWWCDIDTFIICSVWSADDVILIPLSYALFGQLMMWYWYLYHIWYALFGQLMMSCWYLYRMLCLVSWWCDVDTFIICSVWSVDDVMLIPLSYALFGQLMMWCCRKHMSLWCAVTRKWVFSSNGGVYRPEWKASLYRLVSSLFCRLPVDSVYLNSVPCDFTLLKIKKTRTKQPHTQPTQKLVVTLSGHTVM